jgi:hypothetical protein
VSKKRQEKRRRTKRKASRGVAGRLYIDTKESIYKSEELFIEEDGDTGTMLRKRGVPYQQDGNILFLVHAPSPVCCAS